MRLGTKILILTLAITLGMAGVIVWVVSRDITAYATERARDDIGRAVSDYFARIDALHQHVSGVVNLVLGTPQNRAQLEALAGGEDEASREHFKLVFDEDLPRALEDDRAAFHVVLDFEGRPIFSFARGDARLAESLARDPVAWPLEPLLADEPKLTRRYVLAAGRLYLALGVPLRIEASAPPTHGYFVGYRIDDAWATAVLGDGAAGTPGGADAAGTAHAAGAAAKPTQRTSLHAWFVADGQVVARGVGGPRREGLGGGAAGTVDGNGPGNASDGNGGAPPETTRDAAAPADDVPHGDAARNSDDAAGDDAAARDDDADRVDDAARDDDAARVDAAARDADARGAERAVGPAAAAGPVGRRRPIAFDAAGERFIGEAVAFDLPGGRRGAVAVASSLTHALAPLRRLQMTIAIVTACVLVVAVVAFQFVSNFIAGPVGLLVAGTRRVAKGEFDEPIVLRRRDELGELASSFNEMSVGLQQRDLVKSTFGKFVDPKVVEGFLADPSRLMPGGEKRVQSVMFSDLRGFTAVAERLDPDDLVALLNGHLGDAADIVTNTRGIVDKFIGDAVVAFWGPPITEHAEHPGLACAAALRIVRGVRRLDEACRQLGVPPLGVRVGVATGEVLVGIIGSANKYNYTVMGDTANLASRLEGLNKLYGTSVLVSERTAREAAGAVLTRRVDRVRVVGRAEPVELYEVLAERGESNGELPRRCEAYAEAMAIYDRRAWHDAAAAFGRITREWPDDAPARAMAERCATFGEADPGEGWDGTWNATSK